MVLLLLLPRSPFPMLCPIAPSFSCQSEAALRNWTSFSGYTGDNFNATQHAYRTAMRHLYTAASSADVYVSPWALGYTSWFIYAFAGAGQYMQKWFTGAAGPNVTHARDFNSRQSCSKFVSQMGCSGLDDGLPHADEYYCAWSREVLVPGMTDANNPNYPLLRCQLSPAARFEAAWVLDGVIPPEYEWTGYLAPDGDMLSFLFHSLYRGDGSPGAAGVCSEYDTCQVRPSVTLPFPAWQPSGPMQSADNCREALTEAW